VQGNDCQKALQHRRATLAPNSSQSHRLKTLFHQCTKIEKNQAVELERVNELSENARSKRDKNNVNDGSESLARVSTNACSKQWNARTIIKEQYEAEEADCYQLDLPMANWNGIVHFSLHFCSVRP
jgi:hypothetical protein